MEAYEYVMIIKLQLIELQRLIAIPKIEDLYTNLEGGKMCSTLDLSNAYILMPLEEESNNRTTINTSRRLFKYKRICFGISSAPEIFQRVMDSSLQMLKMVCGYLDDILIIGKDKEEHGIKTTRYCE